MKLGYAARSAVLFIVIICIIIAGCILFETPGNRDVSKEAMIPVVTEKVLIPGGHSIGVRMDVKGVLVVGLEDIVTLDGSTQNPGKIAGLEIGDTILEINGIKVYKATEVQRVVNELKGNLELTVLRKDEILDVELKPVISKEDNLYKLGVWIKDKTAGIGTLTYYDPESKSFGALGHGITDPETGIILEVNEGELLDSKVESVKQGVSGKPGEIHGIFYEAEEPLGKLTVNSKFGLFGEAYNSISNPLYEKPIVVASQSEIEEGPAYILTTIENDKIEKFEIEIERITPQQYPDVKSMIIRVTDEELLRKTGGIVQGMSGSPILQNGKLVGAVTHVLVNDPTRGYGIFIENMLEAAE